MMAGPGAYRVGCLPLYSSALKPKIGGGIISKHSSLLVIVSEGLDAAVSGLAHHRYHWGTVADGLTDVAGSQAMAAEAGRVEAGCDGSSFHNTKDGAS